MDIVLQRLERIDRVLERCSGVAANSGVGGLVKDEGGSGAPSDIGIDAPVRNEEDEDSSDEDSAETPNTGDDRARPDPSLGLGLHQ